MAELRGHVATVSSQQGDRVLVSVPMVGFPEGFQLRQGDRVVIVHGDKGSMAVPLIRSFEATPEQSAALRSGGGGGAALAVSDATIQQGEGDHVIVYTIDREGSGAPQVFAIQRQD